MTSAPPKGLDGKRRTEYIEWAAKVGAGCRATNPAIERAFDEALREARAGLVER